MGLFSNNAITPQQKYATARTNLLLMMGFTLINIVLVVAEADMMFLFSATVPYYSVVFGYVYALAGFPELLYVSIAIAVLCLVAYFLCWLFSKRHYAWMIVAMVLFVLDTLALGLLFLLYNNFSGIPDVLIHLWVLYYLITGVRYGHQLHNAPAVEPVIETTVAEEAAESVVAEPAEEVVEESISAE